MRHFIALSAVTALALTGLAVANTKTVQDEKLVGKFASDLDIKSASAGHAGRRLAHKVELYGAIPDRFSGMVCVQVLSRRSPSAGPGPAQAQEDARARSICIQNKKQTRVPVVKMATGKTTGHARVRYPDPRTVRFVFTKRSIGSPARYFWRADTAFETDKRNGPCPESQHGYSCFDNAPEVGREARHRL